MISIGATGLAYQALDALVDAKQIGAHFRAEDPAVLERRVNARGSALFDDDEYELGGIQIGGAGKGHQFAVALLMNNVNTNALGRFAPDDDQTDGLRAFFYAGETPEALANSFAAAQQRIEVWAPSGSWDRTARAWELGGASDGMRFMGCIVVYRAIQG